MKPAVVAIFSHKQNLSECEKVSLTQCWRILGSHPIHLVCPAGLEISEYLEIAPGIRVTEVDPRNFRSLRAYNRLKILPELYRRFSGYEFLLTYELDAFVFRDELLHWCEAGYDYVGAPWFETYDQAEHHSRVIPGGNSGFSLRRISSALKVTSSVKTIQSWKQTIHENLSLDVGALKKALLLGRAVFGNNFHHSINQFAKNEDIFWSVWAPEKFEWFKVAPFPKAKRFSFDMLPRRLYLENDRSLPFGCHKWSESNLAFWKPFIEAEGYNIQAFET